MSVQSAIKRAEQVLPGVPGSDVRGERLVDLSTYVDTHPEPLWKFIARWGTHEKEELRTVIGLYLLEHLLSHHFDLIFHRVERLAVEDPLFAHTFRACRKMGQSEIPENEERWDALLQRVSS